MISNGIYFDEFPPPRTLIKAMRACHAHELVRKGEIAFGNLAVYRKWENPVLGDNSDGYGMFVVNNSPLKRGTINNIYAFCASFPHIKHDRLKLFAEKCEYDSLVTIHNACELLNRIKIQLLKVSNKFTLHCSLVMYNKGAETDMTSYNSQDFDFNIFQKHEEFKDDEEYRIAIKDINVKAEYSERLVLQLGTCSDIVSVEPLE